jgi:hypothetical protein
LIKKIIFKRTKASSSGDITKNLKNGLNKMMINGIDKLNLSNISSGNSNSNNNGSISNSAAKEATLITAQQCQGQQCCGIYVKNSLLNNGGNHYKYNNGHSDLNFNSNNSNNKCFNNNIDMLTDLPTTATTTVATTNPSLTSSTTSTTTTAASAINGGAVKMEYLDAVDSSSSSSKSLENSSLSKIAALAKSSSGPLPINGGVNLTRERSDDDDGYDNDYYMTTTDKHVNQDVWYMCDDDKIKVMSKREFQDLLMPNNKIMITPYLLFFARFNAQPS